MGHELLHAPNRTPCLNPWIALRSIFDGNLSNFGAIRKILTEHQHTPNPKPLNPKPLNPKPLPKHSFSLFQAQLTYINTYTYIHTYTYMHTSKNMCVCMWYTNLQHTLYIYIHSYIYLGIYLLIFLSIHPTYLQVRILVCIVRCV